MEEEFRSEDLEADSLGSLEEINVLVRSEESEENGMQFHVLSKQSGEN